MLRFIGVTVAIVCLVAVWGWKVSREGHDVAFDFGQVLPGQALQTTFSIRNLTSAVVTYGGFDEACGVTPEFSSNGILGAGESGTLTLTARATRRRGPGGASFILKEQTEGQVHERTFRLSWNVAGGPWLDSSEVWLSDTLSSDITVMNPGASLQVRFENLPTGVQADVQGTRLVINCTAESPPGRLGVLRVIVLSNGKEYNFDLPIYVRDPGGPRLYPAVATLAVPRSGEAVRVARVVGEIGKDWAVHSESARDSVRLASDGSVWFSPSAENMGAAATKLFLVDPEGKRVSEATLLIQELL